MLSEPSLPDFYRAHGFTITPHLQVLIDTYGETKVVSPMEPEKFSVMEIGRPVVEITCLPRAIEFCDRSSIQDGHEEDVYERVSTFLGSPVAPVGSISTSYELLLTEDGRLVGECDGFVVTWGQPGCDWRASIAAYLAGERERGMGHLKDIG